MPLSVLALAFCTILPLPETGCAPLTVRAPAETLRVAVVSDERARERGLMKVPELPHNQGMLFAFPDGNRVRYFWMKDTITPLDMVFVRGDGVVTEIAAGVPATIVGAPEETIERRAGTARYVIEMRSGEAARAGIRRGTRLRIPEIAAR